MSTDLVAMNKLLLEYNELSQKPKHDKQDHVRMAFLQTGIAALRSGASMDEVNDLFTTDAARRGGVNLTKKRSAITRAQQVEARGWNRLVESFEQRDMVE